MRKAREAGIGAVGLVGGGDIFMLGYYVEKIARAGLVGMVFTNTHPIRVHPAGGIDPLLGTNPLAFGFPVAGARADHRRSRDQHVGDRPCPDCEL